ncbi:hypothetical protein H8D79_00870 [PVC group bacterium]|nr:hypothetical protein [PVC group bacterium]
MPKPKVLWIEDDVRVGVSSLAGPVFASARYDLTIALNATDAVHEIQSGEFDVVVVDIRVPPGDDSQWVKLYRESGMNKMQARLGIELLRALLQGAEANYVLKETPGWIDSTRFGILTVESVREVRDDMAELRVSHFRQKNAGMSENTLLELIDEVLADDSRSESI